MIQPPTLPDPFQDALDKAEKVLDPAAIDRLKPRLLVEEAAPDRTVSALRDLLAKSGSLYDRGLPVRLAYDQTQGTHVAQVLTPDVLVLVAHTACRPYALREKKGETVEVDVRLPRQFATMYLDWRGEWNLRPLNGVAPTPLLSEDGTIHFTEGYDTASGIWCERVPDIAGNVACEPTRAEAEVALHQLRHAFRTFCFADAAIVKSDEVAVVHTDEPPGMDESAFLNGLLTAVCRPSLRLAPGVLIRAAPMSGAGAGKGLLARCISEIAFGREPHAVTSGSTLEELEKRISAELMGGSPMLFLDNLNNTAFKSDLLASAITESPARVRVLGRSQMVPLNATAFIVLTGNGLTMSEDLARRFITVELDPRTEDPEARSFPGDIRLEIRENRAELLAAAVTVWRWGRLEGGIPRGRPIGSFETWARWVRDPLMALGCRDPIERLGEAKARDARRQSTAELFKAWWDCHGDHPVFLRDLDDRVVRLVDPQGRGRQFVSAQFEKLAGTRIAGLVLTRQSPAGHWGVTTYRMSSSEGDPESHGHHRGHRAWQTSDAPYAPYALPGRIDTHSTVLDPMPPMPPMPSDAARDAKSGWSEEVL